MHTLSIPGKTLRAADIFLRPFLTMHSAAYLTHLADNMEYECILDLISFRDETFGVAKFAYWNNRLLTLKFIFVILFAMPVRDLYIPAFCIVLLLCFAVKIASSQYHPTWFTWYYIPRNLLTVCVLLWFITGLVSVTHMLPVYILGFGEAWKYCSTNG